MSGTVRGPGAIIPGETVDSAKVIAMNTQMGQNPDWSAESFDSKQNVSVINQLSITPSVWNIKGMHKLHLCSSQCGFTDPPLVEVWSVCVCVSLDSALIASSWQHTTHTHLGAYVGLFGFGCSGARRLVLAHSSKASFPSQVASILFGVPAAGCHTC